MYQREFFFFGSFFLFASLICFTPSSHSLCFPRSGKTVARYFGATSGLWSFHSRRPTQIRLRTKRKNEQEKFSHVFLSKQAAKEIFYFLDLHVSCQVSRFARVKPPVPTMITDFRQTERFKNESFPSFTKITPGKKPRYLYAAGFNILLLCRFYPSFETTAFGEGEKRNMPNFLKSAV